MTRKEYEEVLNNVDYWNEMTLEAICLKRRGGGPEYEIDEYFKKVDEARDKARDLYDLRYATEEDFQRLLRAERMFAYIRKVENILEEKEEVICNMEYTYERDDIILRDKFGRGL